MSTANAPRTMTTSMTGGMAIVESLLAMGVDRVYGLPGAQLNPLFDALAQHTDKIRTHGARHEQTCGYMAFGAARSTGRPGIFTVVPGPGLLAFSAVVVLTIFASSSFDPRLIWKEATP